MIMGFLDPYILACPANLDDEDSIVSYVRKLISWRDLKDKAWMELILPRTASESLGSTNGFPPWQVLNDVLVKKDIGIQPSDVFTVLNALLNKGPTIEDLSGIREILLDDIVCQPDYSAGRRQVYIDEYQRLLGLISLFRTKTDMPPGLRQLYTSNAPCPHDIEFSASLIEIEYSDPATAVPILPASIEDNLMGICCAVVAMKKADPLSIWETAVSAADIKGAISLSVYQHALANHMTVPHWTMGSHFVPSIMRMNVRSRAAGARILRACYETILGLRLEGVHAIRTSIAGNSSQMKRGKDGAVRRDIDHELHLHYWDTANGPELACISPHNDFSIPE